MKGIERNDFAVAVGWPETYCKQPGAWFDSIGKWLNLNKNGYYKVGHSALLLIDSKNEQCFYYDFGRYHTPFRKGRVRSHITDPLLEVKTKPIFNAQNTKILNLPQILEEMQRNPEYHTEGKLIASYTHVNFSSALAKVKAFQQQEILDYGLLKRSKMNCGRFVSQVIRAGKPHWFTRFRLQYCTLLVPSTKSNFLALKHKTHVSHLRNGDRFYPSTLMTKKQEISILDEPEKPTAINSNAKWLGGEGMGSWFDISHNQSTYTIQRWTEIGVLESDFHYIIVSGTIDLNMPYEYSYPSNSEVVTIVQKNTSVRFVKQVNE
jgi:hypothetical protein